MIISVNKKLLEEGVIDHIKRNSGKYLAGAGVAAGLGIANAIGMGDNITNNITNSVPEEEMGLMTKAGIGLGGASTLAMMGANPNETKALGKNINKGVGTVARAVNSSYNTTTPVVAKAVKDTVNSTINAANNLNTSMRQATQTGINKVSEVAPKVGSFIKNAVVKGSSIVGNMNSKYSQPKPQNVPRTVDKLNVRKKASVRTPYKKVV